MRAIDEKLEAMQTFFIDTGGTKTDPYNKLVEESGLAKIFGTNLLKAENINFEGQEHTYTSNDLIYKPGSPESKDYIYFVTQGKISEQIDEEETPEETTHHYNTRY